MIKLNQLTLRRGAKVLLNQTNLTLLSHEHVGLIGRNGSGKSSLFAMLRGEIAPDGGNAATPPLSRISWVAQETPALPTPAEQYVVEGDSVLFALQERINTEEDGMMLSELFTQFEELGGHDVLPRARKLLAGLGFAQDELQNPVATFSGGWRMRLNLARALMQPADCLLLDEPTNHLDLDTINWLEKWIQDYTGLVVIISHDREFLDTTVKTIVHIDGQQLVRYTANYSGFEHQRAERLNLITAAERKNAEKRASLTHFIERFGAKASKAKQAQSRVKQLEKMTSAAPKPPEDIVHIHFFTPDRLPDPVLEIDQADCGYSASAPILRKAHCILRPGERIAVLGRNGAGKSTLIKTLTTEIALLSGERREGKGIRIGYFAQHQIDTLDPEATPLESMKRGDKQGKEQAHRNFLASFGFKGDMATSPIGPMSGGERSRLALALIAYTKPNILILDEPTNHLDLDARDSLTDALVSFEGNIILVSHDRSLIRATADSLWLVADGRLQDFEGDLDDYKDWLAAADKQAKKDAKTDKAAPLLAALPATKSAASNTALPANAVLNSNFAASAKKPVNKNLQTRIAKLEQKIAAQKEALATVNAALSDPTFYTKDPAKASDMGFQHAELSREIEGLEEQWLEMQMEAEG